MRKLKRLLYLARSTKQVEYYRRILRILLGF